VGQKKKKAKKKRRQPGISQAKRKAMFEVFCETGTEHHVRKKCAAHWTTVAKYRKIDNWDERYAKVQADANKKADKQVANAMATRIRHYRAIADAALNRRLREIRDQQKEGIASPELRLTVHEQVALEKLIELLEGRPTERGDDKHNTDPRIERLLTDIGNKLGKSKLAELGDELADEK
jgi:hypothetical protein